MNNYYYNDPKEYYKVIVDYSDGCAYNRMEQEDKLFHIFKFKRKHNSKYQTGNIECIISRTEAINIIYLIKRGFTLKEIKEYIDKVKAPLFNIGDNVKIIDKSILTITQFNIGKGSIGEITSISGIKTNPLYDIIIDGKELSLRAQDLELVL